MSYRRRSRSRSRERHRSRSKSRERDVGRSRFRNGRPPNIEGMVSLKVDNLSYRITPEDLQPMFERYGDVGDIYIPRDRFTKESRGFSFVRFYDKRDAEDAMDKMDGYVMDGREMRVQMARYGRPAEPPQVRHGRGYVPPARGYSYSRVVHVSRVFEIQWDLSNPDTNGAEESVIVSEVSSFQRLSKGVTWGRERCPI